MKAQSFTKILKFVILRVFVTLWFFSYDSEAVL